MSNVSPCVLFSLLIVGIFPFAINKKVKSDEQSSWTDLIASVFTLMKCLPMESHLTLVLAGDYSEFLVHSHNNMIPVALIDERNPRFDTFRNGLRAHRFVLVTSSQPLLRALLQRARDSPWANPEGFYILVDKQTKIRGCINARSYLWTAWEYDLLSVIFICIDPKDGIVLYTFNPYSNNTPDSWLEVEHIKGRAGHPWIILRRKFIHDSNICIDLNFDKTTTLNRYQIRLSAMEMEPFVKINMSLPKQERFRGVSSDIIKMLLNKLNVSREITILHRNDSLAGIEPNDTYKGLMAFANDRRIDITMNTRYIFEWWKIKYLYPHMKSSICVIAQPKKQISEFIKIINFLSPEVIAGILGICLLTYIIFVKWVGYIKAGLEMIRLVISVGFLHLPKMDSARIFISMVLILFLNINALFQSRLSSLLTVPVYYRDIDSIQSLKDAGYTLYGPKIFKNIINEYDPIFQSRYKITNYKDCMEHVKNSSTAVCVGDCYHFYYRIKNQGLIKSETLRPMMRSYATCKNWPLYNRVNDIMHRMMQTGLIKKAEDKFLLQIKREKEKHIALTKKSFNVMSLKQLTFSFYFLGFGYACAVIVFVLELTLGGSIPVCQNKKVAVKKERKNARKKSEFKTDSKLSILALKTDLEFKRKLRIEKDYMNAKRTQKKKQCIFKSCTLIENEK